MASNHTATNQADTNKQLAENTLSSINDASTAGRALYTGFMALTAYIIVALGTTDDLQLFERAALTLPLLNVEISLTGFYRYTSWLYVIVHANLLLLFSMIAEKHRYFAELVDHCAWPDRVHLRQQLHVNAFTQFLGADHSGLLAVILMLMIWFTVGLMPPLLLLAIQLDFLAAQIESVTDWQKTAVLIDGLLVCFFWNNILQKARRARFPKDWNPEFWKRYPKNGFVLFISVLFIVVFSWIVALVPLSDYERKVHNKLPEWLGLAKNECILDKDLKSLRNKNNINELMVKSSLSSKEAEILEKFTRKENAFNSQLANAAKNAREWATPYRCSNWLTWWLIDRTDSWLSKSLETRRWLNLPDKVLVKNRETVPPEWLNRLNSGLGDSTEDTKASIRHRQTKNTSNITNTDKLTSFKTLDYFLPVEKENQHFHFARFIFSFLPNAKLRKAELQGAHLWGAQLQGANLWKAQLQGAKLWWAQLQIVNLHKAQLQSADLYRAQLQGADLRRAQLHGADLSEAQLQGADLSEVQLQGADLSRAQLQGSALLSPYLIGAQFSGTNFDYAMILNPIVDWKESDNNLLSRLNTYKSAAVNEKSKEILLAAIKRITDAKKNKSLPDMSNAKLGKQEHRCLLFTDNRELKNMTQHICDNADDLSINPLIHLRNWAKYNVSMSCQHKHFSVSAEDYTRKIATPNAYEIVKNYRAQALENNDIKLEDASEALLKLANFFHIKQLIQIHQDKSILCEARTELDVWYKESWFENNPALKDRILNQKLKPFPTSRKFRKKGTD